MFLAGKPRGNSTRFPWVQADMFYKPLANVSAGTMILARNREYPKVMKAATIGNSLVNLRLSFKSAYCYVLLRIFCFSFVFLSG